MSKPKFTYHTAAQSNTPGYLKRRFAQYRQELRAKAERERQNEIERQAKVEPMKQKKAKAA